MMPSTLPALLAHQVIARPDAVAVIDGDRRMTYGELAQMAGRAALWLAAQGIGPGDRVAVWLVNRLEWLALLFGLARLGASLVAVNTRYRAAELEHILKASGARLLVLEPGFRHIDFAGVLATVDPGAAAALERIAVIGEGPTRLLERPTVSFDAPMREGAEPPDASTPDTIAAMFTTSGTTRGPKLVMQAQGAIAAHAQAIAAGMGLAAPDACLLAALPLCGVFGFDAVLGALAGGAPAVLMDVFAARPAVDLVRRHHITHVFGSDEMARRMLEAAPGPAPFPSLRKFGFAAFQPGSAELAREGWARGVPLLGLYGSSEVQALFAMQPVTLPLDERIEAGGRPVSTAAAVRIRDVETGALLPPGLSGEIEIRAESLFAGYFGDPPATAAVMRPDGFFRTGDIGRLRADGTFIYETRAGDAMRLSGYLVSPAEIEEVVKAVPGIADAQVVAVEHAGRACCVAFAIPASPPPAEATVIAAAAARLAAFKVPQRILFLDAFPTTPSANGTKIQRARLRAMALDHLKGNPA
jgi:fatty-acyl-CoA synthase